MSGDCTLLLSHFLLFFFCIFVHLADLFEVVVFEIAVAWSAFHSCHAAACLFPCVTSVVRSSPFFLGGGHIPTHRWQKAGFLGMGRHSPINSYHCMWTVLVSGRNVMRRPCHILSTISSCISCCIRRNLHAFQLVAIRVQHHFRALYRWIVCL